MFICIDLELYDNQMIFVLTTNFVTIKIVRYESSKLYPPQYSLLVNSEHYVFCCLYFNTLHNIFKLQL